MARQARPRTAPRCWARIPTRSEEITLRSGRFGPYVQRGDGKEAKRSSLPKGWTVEAMDHEKALALLSLPRDVGQHPESGKMISAGIGRYGPFVLHDGTYANLDSVEDVFSIGLNRAVSVIAEKQLKGRGGRNGGTPAALKSLGEHPDGGEITVRDGKYGPYVNHGKVNATLPKGKDPVSVTLDEAVAMIAEKAAKGDSGKKSFRGKSAPPGKGPDKPWRGASPGQSTAIRAPASERQGDFRPSREEVLQFIAENPDRSGKRDIAKAFSLKGDGRIWLKDLLRDLQDDGLLQKDRKRLIRPGALPHVVVLDVFGRDTDGGLLAKPSEYTGEEPAPTVSIRAAARRRRPAPGIGDRLLAKVFPTGEATGPAYTGRVVKIFEKRRDAVLGVFRTLKDGTFRIEPVERRQPELIVEPELRGDAKDGDLVEVEPARASRYGLPRGKVIAVLGSLTSEKAVSMIAIHAHDIPHIFPASRDRRGGSRQAGDDGQSRGLARIAAGDHRSGRRQGSRRRGVRRARPGREEPRRLHRHGGDRRCRGLCAAGFRARPRGAEARQFGLFPRPRRADAAGAHLQRSLLAEGRTRTALPLPCA